MAVLGQHLFEELVVCATKEHYDDVVIVRTPHATCEHAHGATLEFVHTQVDGGKPRDFDCLSE